MNTVTVDDFRTITAARIERMKDHPEETTAKEISKMIYVAKSLDMLKPPQKKEEPEK